MTFRDDFPDEMEDFPFDDTAADAVFGHSHGADAAPEELRDVAELVAAARRTGSADELVGEATIVARIAAAMGEPAASPQGGTHERIAVLKKLRATKVTAAATAVLLLGGTAAAAAATGSLPTSVHHHHAALAVAHAVAAPRHHEAHTAEVPNVSGAVASGNGVADPGTCGVAGVAGTLTLTTHDSQTFTINVSTTTTFAEKDVATPSFADVCVGSNVWARGATTGMVVTADKIKIRPPRTEASGEVASVDGVTTSGTCGVAGLAGTFALESHEHHAFTVNVSTTTAYVETGVASPTFANVCVGSKVKVNGTFVDTTVTATTVTIKPPHVRTGAMGIVASVNGVSTAGTCGTAGLAGTFTLTGHPDKTWTVNVDPATTFAEKDVAAPTFANVCVGEFVMAKGTVVDPTVTATQVFIAPTHVDDKHNKHDKHHDGHQVGAFGTVASVNGVTTDGTCGAAGTAGTFSITGFKGTIFTVNVTTTTNFKVPGVTDPTFANVCVGGKVAAKGDTTDTTVAATDVFVLPAHTDGDHEGDKHHGDHHGFGRGGPKGDREVSKHSGKHDQQSSTRRHGDNGQSD